MAEAMTVDAPGEDVPLAPAPGEVARLTAAASARARDDGAHAVKSSVSARDAFDTFEDAHLALMAFHAYAGPEDVAWSERAATRDGAARDDAAARDAAAQADESMKLSREASWTRDVNVFAKTAGDFIDAAREKLAESSSKSRVVDVDELALMERLASAHTREVLRTEKVERQMAVARAATLEREIRHYENLIRLREVEKAPELTTINAPPESMTMNAPPESTTMNAPPESTTADSPPENPHLAQT
jgi:hypothetical protein